MEEQIADIPNVDSWAKKAGVSRRWLCKSMKAVYGKSPKIIPREMKYEKVVLLIRENGMNVNCYSVAVDAGLKTSKNVSRFLTSYYDTNFTKLKMDLIQEDIQVDFSWLNGSKN